MRSLVSILVGAQVFCLLPERPCFAAAALDPASARVLMESNAPITTSPASIGTGSQDSLRLRMLLHGGLAVFSALRLPNGMYLDSKMLAGADTHPISIASAGMGLITLCVAHAMGWLPGAADSALATLDALSGSRPGFTPDRNASGYFRHFLAPATGANAWNSEYSTIDTDILICGALFCGRYFRDARITARAEALRRSIDFGAAIADPEGGRMFLAMRADGSGDSAALTSVYNEYMIAAWLARNADTAKTAPGARIWERYFADPGMLPHKEYAGIPVLTDNPSAFLSSFTHVFNYYLCHPYAQSQAYLSFHRNARQADSLWWRTSGGGEPFEWGLGAGATAEGYGVDRIGANPGRYVSPHIIAGFIPVHPDGAADLLAMLSAGKGVYPLPFAKGDTVLWRYSLADPAWKANEIEGVDFSTLVFGLAAAATNLGPGFFAAYNDFFRDAAGVLPQPGRRNGRRGSSGMSPVRKRNPAPKLIRGGRAFRADGKGLRKGLY